ncbi:MAG: hypothetical protein Kow002_13990 [Anaerolineales bacterium]
MFVRCVIQDQVCDDANIVFVGLVYQGVEVVQTAIRRMDVITVGDVVAIIFELDARTYNS